MRIVRASIAERRDRVLKQALASYQKKLLTPTEAMCYIAQLSELQLLETELERLSNDPISSEP